MNIPCRFRSALVAGAMLALSAGIQAAPEELGQTFGIRLVGAAHDARQIPASVINAPSLYFDPEQRDTTKPGAPLIRNGFRNVYPGVDLVCYGDDYNLEYVFVLAPGADPSRIQVQLQGHQAASVTHTGSIRIQVPGGEVIQTAPSALMGPPSRRRQIDGAYLLDERGLVTLQTGKEFEEQFRSNNGTRLNIISGGGQPGGPSYSFYLSKYELTNDQYLRFLNDIEGNKDRAGTVVFDKRGNVWINPEMKKNRDELFDLSASQLIYDPSKPAGSRYGHLPAKDGSFPAAKHPVTGISWFGALKYCNWGTVRAGRGANEVCYREGTNVMDWAPITATNWARGQFGDDERQLLTTLKGFRLPMINSDVSGITTNPFSEYFKAASWRGSTNSIYGFGRDSFEGLDANYSDTSNRPPDLRTFEVGFFDGKHELGNQRTRRNDNFFGIDDLSGNVSEWVNDTAVPGNVTNRAACGGSWFDRPLPASKGKALPPNAVSRACGFRVMTTYFSVEPLYIHFLYTFYVEPPGPSPTRPKLPGQLPTELAPPWEAVSPPEPPPPAPDKEKEGVTLEVSSPPMKTDGFTPSGVTYKTPEEKKTPVAPAPAPAPSPEPAATPPEVLVPAEFPSDSGAPYVPPPIIEPPGTPSGV